MRAVIYCRISEDRTGQAAGVQRQEADARALCERHGWNIVDVIVDNDVSASSYSRKARPGYQQVLALAVAGEVDVIAVYDVDRLYRQPSELEQLIALAERITISSVQGEMRLDTPDGRLVARLVASVAAKASDDTSRRVKRKHLERAEAGLPSVSRRRPFGFELDARTIREVEAARIREAAARILGGDSLRSIRRDWTDAGVFTTDGNEWQTTTIKRLLLAPRVAGLRALNGVVVGPAVWPPILERDVWEGLRSVLTANPGQAPARSYLLTGLIHCGECGAAMQPKPMMSKGKSRRRYYCWKERGGCNRVGIDAERCEADIVDGFIDYTKREDKIRRGAPIDLSAAAVADLLRVEANLAELAEMVVSGAMKPPAYKAVSDGLSARADALRAEIAASYRNGDMEALAASDAPLDVWKPLPWDRKRALLTEALVRVDISVSSGRGAGYEEDRVVPTWKVNR